jgi:hypothetical protein
MKTSTLLIAAGAVGVLYMLAKSKQGLGDDDMLMPPTGRTVTASGQVLGDLGGFGRKYVPKGGGATGNASDKHKKALAAATAAKNKEAEDTRIAALAQQKVNETLAAIQKQADEEMARQEQERQAAAEKAEAERQVQAEAERQAEIERRSAELQSQAQQMPERITSIQTPAAIMLPEAKPEKPAGDSKVGFLVGGGVLAAIAAGIMS